MIAFELLGIAMLLVGVIWAVITDFRSLRIPNPASLTIAAGFLVYGLSTQQPIPWLGSLAVAGLVFAIGFLLFALNLFGGGDAKMMTAAALWAGPDQILDLLLVTALAGGGLALIWLSPLKYALQLVTPGAQGVSGPNGGDKVRKKKTVPYALAIAAGTIAIMPAIPTL